jgi:hypothetical protein
MNIIQMQDRLKGLPEETLINYVKNPMGEVPIYLALSEIQRRNDMRDRYEASQTEKPSVAEQLVAESKPMQMGLGAMAPQQMMPGAQGVGTPPPAQELTPTMLAASGGIVSNPVNNVGGPAMMAAGGIVPGYAVGTLVPSALSLLKKGYDVGKGFIMGKPGVAATAPVATGLQGQGRMFIPGRGAVDAVPNVFKRAPLRTSAVAGAGLYGLLPDDSEVVESTGDTGDTGGTNNTGNTGSTDSNKDNSKLTKKELLNLAKEQKAAIDELIGPDLGREDLLARTEKKKADNLNMALIQAGLGMASGQSANFLDNLTAGATAGVESYSETQDEVDKILADIDKQKRTEDVAIATKALDLRGEELDRANELEKAKIMSTGQTTGGYYGVSKQQNLFATKLLADKTYQMFIGPLTSLQAKEKTSPDSLTKEDKLNMQKYKNAIDIVRARIKEELGMGQPIVNTGNQQVINVPF